MKLPIFTRKAFHGAGKKASFFEGWYMKHQCGRNMAALIPAYHIAQDGREFASLQLVTPELNHYFTFPASSFRACEDRFALQLGDNLFTRRGVRLKLETPELKVRGELHYGSLKPPRYDIMGPFSLVPYLQCNHGILSLSHSVSGRLEINGKTMNFDRGTGYIEKDWGRSFPKSYLWTQCSFKHKEACCIMLSVADIPMPVAHFTGCICAVWYDGAEYRLATYLGARIVNRTPSHVMLVQGRLRLEVSLLKSAPRSLKAPSFGDMTRTIKESPSCTVHYRFWKNEELLFDFISFQAGFETG